jgi:hypothetical protein
MPFATVTPGSAMVGGRLYCLGGADTGAQLKGNIFNYVQIYQPSASTPLHRRSGQRQRIRGVRHRCARFLD